MEKQTNAESIPYKGRNHGTMEHEWLVHKGTPGWWYITGTFTDDLGNMYSYQFTVIHAKQGIVHPWVLHLALTDFQSEKHYFSQEFQIFKHGIVVNENFVGFKEDAQIEKREDGIYLKAMQKDFELELKLAFGKKNPVWHCEDGYLSMGTADSGESTIYYSYTNLPTTGTLKLKGETKEVTGKSWFDRQSGPYDMMAKRNHWEWFSLRFNDDEEAMLFSFPQNPYQDGTFIAKDGSYRRLNTYTIKPLNVVEVEGLKFSSGWDIFLPGVKEEHYKIEPIMKGQMNVGYFEQLAKIINKDGQEVGLCFVELLPGVLNDEYKDTMAKNITK